MSTGLVDWTRLEPTLLALLLCGHLLADFVLQPSRMLVGKRQHLRWLLAHGGVVFVVHALVLAPFFLAGGLGLLLPLGLAATHVMIDRAKIAQEELFGARLSGFVLDQVLHLAVILGAWIWLRERFVEAGLGPLHLDPDPHLLGPLALILGVFAFSIHGGSAIVAGVLGWLREERSPAPQADGFPRAGRLIGILERLALLPLIWMGQWSALGFVLAAKSVARFKALEEREFAETYLVGTLTSFLVAGAAGLLLRLLVPLG